MKTKTHTSPTINFHKLGYLAQEEILMSLKGPQLRDIQDALGIKGQGTKTDLVEHILNTDYAKKTTFALNTNLANI